MTTSRKIEMINPKDGLLLKLEISSVDDVLDKTISLFLFNSKEDKSVTFHLSKEQATDVLRDLERFVKLMS